DSGFTIFYMGINLGAFLAPLIAGSLGEIYGWEYGFTASGIGMLLGLVIFASTQKYLKNVGLPPKAPAEQTRLRSKDYISIVIWTIGVAALVYGMLTLFTSMSDSAYRTVTNTIFAVGVLGVIYFIFTNTNGSDEWSRVGVIFVLAFFNIFFWAGFEQAGGTFNLFAEENTNRQMGSYLIPTTWFQSINAFAIFSLAPVFAILWIFLSKRKLNPNIPVKFGLGLILLGLGFVVMFFANQKASGGNLVSPLWLVMVYLLHTVGELFLSPIGLSMITKLSPPKIVSLMMGLWFTSIALANYMAGILESLLHKFEMNLFLFLVVTSFAGGLIMLAISPILKKMMRGVS
ncbi:MAG TPA: oligopeptide:H+ symporter, partial [Phnomibacter sp.]|nr:oligopeptide:H+ symporter [Phnomibacter sp.]